MKPCIQFLAILIFFIPVRGFSQGWEQVKWVIDGDTVVLENREKVRYIGIDAPEIRHEDREGDPFGEESKRFNKTLVMHRKVRLEFIKKRHDQYGRKLAYVFLEDGTFVNGRLVAEGLAFFLPGRKEEKYDNRILALQRAAMKARKGMWKKFQDKKGPYIGNRRSRRFHKPDCRFGKQTGKRNRRIFRTKWDAFFAGFAPGARCFGKKRD